MNQPIQISPMDRFTNCQLKPLLCNDRLQFWSNIANPLGLRIDFYQPTSDIKTSCINHISFSEGCQIGSPPTNINIDY